LLHDEQYFLFCSSALILCFATQAAFDAMCDTDSQGTRNILFKLKNKCKTTWRVV